MINSESLQVVMFLLGIRACNIFYGKVSLANVCLDLILLGRRHDIVYYISCKETGISCLAADATSQSCSDCHNATDENVRRTRRLQWRKVAYVTILFLLKQLVHCTLLNYCYQHAWHDNLYCAIQPCMNRIFPGNANILSKFGRDFSSLTIAWISQIFNYVISVAVFGASRPETSVNIPWNIRFSDCGVGRPPTSAYYEQVTFRRRSCSCAVCEAKFPQCRGLSA